MSGPPIEPEVQPIEPGSRAQAHPDPWRQATAKRELRALGAEWRRRGRIRDRTLALMVAAIVIGLFMLRNTPAFCS